MKRKAMKFVVIMLVLILTVTAIAGCGSSSGGNAASTAAAATNAASTVKESSKADAPDMSPIKNDEKQWLIKYLISIEEADEKSDMFRFPFEDEFLAQYRNKFLDNVAVANNMLQAFSIIKKARLMLSVYSCLYTITFRITLLCAVLP